MQKNVSLPEIYLELIKKPTAPRYYRALRDYYSNRNMLNEANAFQHLLVSVFNEPIELNDNNSHPTDLQSNNRTN